LSLTNILLDPDTVINGAYTQTTRAPRSWQTTTTEGYDYTSEVAALAALATCVLTSGWGLGWGQSFASLLNVTNSMGVAAVSVGVSSVVSQAASGLILRDGNIEAVGRDLISSSSLRSLVTSMAGAALVQGLGEAFKLPLGIGQARTLPQHLQINVLRSAVNSGLSMAVEGTDPGVALRQGVRSVVASTLGGVGSNHIGSAYHEGVLDYITHKVLHAVLGAATGAILNEDALRGALSGAVGAVTAEVVADMFREDATQTALRVFKEKHEQAEKEERVLTKEELEIACKDALQKKADIAKMAAAAMAFGTGQDIHTATATATNAVENNYAQLGGAAMKVAFEIYVLTHEEEIVQTKEKICKIVAKKIGVEPKAVEVVFEILLMTGSITHAAKQSGKFLWKNVFKKITQKEIKKIKEPSGSFKGNKITPQERSEMGTFNSSVFDKKVTWTSPSGTKQPYKIYQRNDIDWNMLRTKGDRKFIGKTNADAAKAGLAPQLKDGHFATLHHIGQNAKGPLVEASTHLHSFESTKLPNGKRPFDILHSSHGAKAKHPEFPVNHEQFKLEAKKYWQYRAKDF
jgi:hypothetical protein